MRFKGRNRLFGAFFNKNRGMGADFIFFRFWGILGILALMQDFDLFLKVTANL